MASSSFSTELRIYWETVAVAVSVVVTVTVAVL